MAGRGTDIILGGNPDSLGIGTGKWQQAHDSVMSGGGLHIIGTERHEARRIDNQLRGRAGRQGDPGSTKFFVALDDELMRRFGGERISNFMEWAGLEEDVPIETKMISKSIESAQVKVEAYHFDMRKHHGGLRRRDEHGIATSSIGSARRLLSGADPKANILDMVDEEIEEIMSEHLAGRTESQWDADAFLRDLGGVFPPATHGLTADSVLDMSFGELSDWLHGFARTCYEDLEEKLTPEVASGIAQQVMLRAIDHNWVLHLTGMMDLRESVGLYAYGQREPAGDVQEGGPRQVPPLSRTVSRTP